MNFTEELIKGWADYKENIFQMCIDKITPGADDDIIIELYERRVVRTALHEELWFKGFPLVRVTGRFEDSTFIMESKVITSEEA